MVKSRLKVDNNLLKRETTYTLKVFIRYFNVTLVKLLSNILYEMLPGCIVRLAVQYWPTFRPSFTSVLFAALFVHFLSLHGMPSFL